MEKLTSTIIGMDFRIPDMMNRLTEMGMSESTALLMSTVFFDGDRDLIPECLNNAESIQKWVKFRKDYLFINGQYGYIVPLLYKNVKESKNQNALDQDDTLLNLLLKCNVPENEAKAILKRKELLQSNTEFTCPNTVQFMGVVEFFKKIWYEKIYFLSDE